MEALLISCKIQVATYVCYTKKSRLILSKDNYVLYFTLKILHLNQAFSKDRQNTDLSLRQMRNE